jgi:hypothetical protein
LIVILTPHIWRPEMPQATNHVGPPQSLGLEKRVTQRPRAEDQDGPSLFELVP